VDYQVATCRRGKKFGVTRERIRQLQNVALDKLRRALRKKETQQAAPVVATGAPFLAWKPGDSGRSDSRQRSDVKPETLGVTLTEGKMILKDLQQIVVESQI